MNADNIRNMVNIVVDDILFEAVEVSAMTVSEILHEDGQLDDVAQEDWDDTIDTVADLAYEELLQVYLDWASEHADAEE